MPLAFDATAGGASATSFATVAEATQYFSTRPSSGWWTGLASDTLREGWLMVAAARLEQESFAGRRTSETQRLSWPRAGARDKDGLAIDSDVVPEAVKAAQCEVAAEYYRLSLTSTDPRVPDALAAFESVTVDVISVVPAAPDVKAAPDSLPVAARRWLTGLLVGGLGWSRVVRV